MICSDFQPFTIVNDPGFKNLINILDPRYILPSPYTLSEAPQAIENIELNASNGTFLTCIKIQYNNVETVFACNQNNLNNFTEAPHAIQNIELNASNSTFLTCNKIQYNNVETAFANNQKMCKRQHTNNSDSKEEELKKKARENNEKSTMAVTIRLLTEEVAELRKEISKLQELIKRKDKHNSDLTNQVLQMSTAMQNMYNRRTKRLQSSKLKQLAAM
ncbi:unnamed protein product [Diabrotica balteata]|uniref:Uncharacterized protein n=1 Tax=Diabrotica balteata TaxID=107213 RepID=A0A9N9TD13_DIABA|nr:unnamed protein product [Diabrotica balteata]